MACEHEIYWGTVAHCIHCGKTVTAIQQEKVVRDVRREGPCFCPCHEHPGTYFCEPCSVCGHYHSQGGTPGYRQGWRKGD